VSNRVLVADDDRAIRESLARALELEGYDVVTVADGVEALTRTRRDTFGGRGAASVEDRVRLVTCSIPYALRQRSESV
jgi:CheY-like chemotaxis protein